MPHLCHMCVQVGPLGRTHDEGSPLDPFSLSPFSILRMGGCKKLLVCHSSTMFEIGGKIPPPRRPLQHPTMHGTSACSSDGSLDASTQEASTCTGLLHLAPIRLAKTHARTSLAFRRRSVHTCMCHTKSKLWSPSTWRRNSPTWRRASRIAKRAPLEHGVGGGDSGGRTHERCVYGRADATRTK